MEDGPKKGPDGYENWKAALAGAAPRSTFEFFLYSDAEITGDLPVTPPCPYAFLNALAFRRPGRLAPVVALRIQSHLDDELPPMNATDTSRYHGGTFVD